MTENTIQQKQTVLITGAAKRIGQAIATDLAASDWQVAIHANSNIESAVELASEISSNGGVASAFQADLSKSDQPSKLIQEVTTKLGPLTVLVNCASVFLEDDIYQLDETNFDLHYALHVRAPSFLASEFAKQLPDNVSGNIINIIDQRVLKLTPQFYSYTLSKTALHTATKTMAQALAPKIRVNAIGPGPTLKNERQQPSDFQKQIDVLPLKRGPELSEFAQTIKFLVKTPSITGQMIILDGGQHLIWQTPDVTDVRE